MSTASPSGTSGVSDMSRQPESSAAMPSETASAAARRTVTRMFMGPSWVRVGGQAGVVDDYIGTSRGIKTPPGSGALGEAFGGKLPDLRELGERRMQVGHLALQQGQPPVDHLDQQAYLRGLRVRVI